ncbi:hemopexin repeat-containing protein [Spongisporangium articulatum]|uniref:Hemopexin repeat-containing protein n=1 Tax=Spongisporangium articulatum TaxID=3362603 RepID=A0ABW8AMI4_9ACTN
MGVDRVYFVKGSTVLPYDLDDDVAVDVRWQLDDVWAGLPPAFAAGMDAALDLGTYYLYVFRGGECVRIPCDTHRADDDGPVPIRADFPGLGVARLDAATPWDDGSAYLFTGRYCVRYDPVLRRAGRPQPVSSLFTGVSDTWLGSGVDAAVNPGYGFAYLFRGTEYVRLDTRTGTQLGSPRPIAADWHGLSGPFDAAWCNTPLSLNGSAGALSARSMQPTG